MKVVLVMFKDGERRDFPIQGERTVIGRRSDCALRIPTADVSREHASIQIKGREISVRDMGSTNGTFINGKKVAEAKLKAGDKLGIGPVVFVVQVDGMPSKISPDAAAASSPGKPVDKGDTADLLDLDDLDFDEDAPDLDQEDAKDSPPKGKRGK